MSSAPRPEIAALRIADPAARWGALGFTVGADGGLALGRADLRLGADGTGITGWSLRHLDPGTVDIDGLPTVVTTAPPSPGVAHPNGAIGLDHVVVVTPAFDRTAEALERAGLPLRRVRDLGSFRQGFRRLGPAILEVMEVPDAPPGPARFWGLVAIVADLEALRERLPDLVGAIRPAVQPGRRIATLAAGAGLSCAVAFMDPE